MTSPIMGVVGNPSVTIGLLNGSERAVQIDNTKRGAARHSEGIPVVARIEVDISGSTTMDKIYKIRDFFISAKGR